MRPPIKDFDELINVVLDLQEEVENLLDVIAERGPSNTVLRLAMGVVDLSCGIAKADLDTLLKPPDELSDPNSETPWQ